MAEKSQVRRQVRRIKNLPTIPNIVKKINKMLENPDTTPADLGRLISQDQVLSAKVLRMANSAFFGMSRKISSITQALIILGFDVVKGLVLSTSVFDMMKQTMDGLWEHSIGCAAAAGVLAKSLGREDAEEITLAGLLHDLGKVVLALEMGREMSQMVKLAADKKISFYEAEKQVLDFHHGQVGRWLAEHWNLPINLVEPINFHHQPELAQVAPEQTAIVHLANIIIKARGFGFSGDRLVPPLSPQAWEMLGFTTKDFDGILENLEPKLMNIEA